MAETNTNAEVVFKKVVTPIRFGIDVGSTTVKVAVIDDDSITK